MTDYFFPRSGNSEAVIFLTMFQNIMEQTRSKLQ